MSEPNLLYAYGVVRPGFDAAGAPLGVDEAPLAVVDAGAFAVLASRVPAATFAPAIVEERSGDMEWVSPRAVAHDRVMTWAQERGGIIPLPMFSLWSDATAMRAGIVAREPQLRDAFERVQNADEYGLRVHRRERDMLARAHELDPAIAALRRDADAAPPGQRYLLERKIGEQSKQAVRAASQRIAREAYAALQPLARAAVIRPLTPSTPGATDETTLVLNAAFLVDRASFDRFRAELTTHVRAAEAVGLAFDFTGPWPPYNFVA
jgi:hypothetical protein